MSKLMYGKGTNSRGKYKTRADGANTLAYKTWRSMIRRCYCPKVQARRPTYIGCSVADEWHDFQDFAEWFENHEYNNYDYELDKDLLVPNNKVYAPDRCAFIPRQLNSLLNSNKAIRGDLPQGIYWVTRAKKYKAQISINGKREYLGLFDCPDEAYQAYKIAKEANVKRMALEWQDRIADNVFQALMNWQLTE